MEPLVSVVIPCFNAESTITRTLNSVDKCGYENFEIIAVNNGSTDNTAKILEAAKRVDDRIKVINQRNSGVSVARNVGVANASSDYIAFLDADDIFFQGSISCRMDVMLEEDSEDLLGVFCPALLLDENLQLLTDKGMFDYALPRDRLYFSTFSGSVFNPSCVIIKKRKFIAAGCFNPELPTAEDFEMWQRMMRMGGYFSKTTACFVGWVQHESSATHGNRLNHYINKKQVIARLFSESRHESVAIENAGGLGVCYYNDTVSRAALQDALNAAIAGCLDEAVEISKDITTSYLDRLEFSEFNKHLEFCSIKTLCEPEKRWPYPLWNKIRINVYELLTHLSCRDNKKNENILSIIEKLHNYDIYNPFDIKLIENNRFSSIEAFCVKEKKNSSVNTLHLQRHDLSKREKITPQAPAVVLNFHKKDQHSAAALLELILTVHEGVECKYYLQYGDDANTIEIANTLARFRKLKNVEFSNTLPDISVPKEFIANDPNIAPFAGNHAIRSKEQKHSILQWNLCLFKYINLLDHFLVIEPDCVILKNNWLKEIFEEYQKCDYPIFGHLKKGMIKNSLIPTHWAGCSVYNGLELRRLPLAHYFYNRYDNPWWPHRNETGTTNANNAFYGPVFSGYDVSYDYFLFALHWKEKTGSNNPVDWPLGELADRSDLIFCDFRSTLAPDEIMSRFAGKLSMMHGVKDDEIRNRMIHYFSKGANRDKACRENQPATLERGSGCSASQSAACCLAEDDILAGSSRKMAVFKDRHKGQRCVIIGNGPSLNKMDLSFLENEITFGMNRIYFLFDKWNFRPTYYASVNPLVLEQSADEILKINAPKFLSNKGIQFFTNPPEDVFFIKSLPKWFFSQDPREGLCEGWTVTFFAMQLAYFMGFSEVVLIGVDHHFITQGDPNKEVVSQGSDPNHFHPDYFGKGIRWHLPDLERSEGSYRMAKLAFESDGRRIIDATVDGKLTVFPKVDYRECFASTYKPAKPFAVNNHVDAREVLNHARLMLDMNRVEEAFSFIENAGRELPGDASLQFALGLICEYRGEKQKAVPYFEKAIRVAPANMEYLRKLAFCYHETCGRSVDALNLLRKVIAADETDIAAYHEIATIYRSLGCADDTVYFNEIAVRLAANAANKQI